MRDPLKNLTAAQCVGTSISVVADLWPYLRDGMVNRFRLYERPGLGTLATDDGFRLHYDPKTVMVELEGLRYTPTAVGHEPWHFILEHPARALLHSEMGWAKRYEDVKPILIEMLPETDVSNWHAFWNLVGDYEILAIQDAAGQEWPPTFRPCRASDHDLPDDQRAEWYAEHFITEAEKVAENGQSGEGDPSPEEQPKSGEQKQGRQKGMGDKTQEGEARSDEPSDAEEGEGGEGSPEVEQPDQPDDKGAGSGSGEGDDDAGDEGSEEGEGGGSGSDGAGESGADEPVHAPRTLGVGRGCCGGCAGNAQDFEKDNGDDAPDPMSKEEVEMARRRVAEDVVEYEKNRSYSQRGVGNVLLSWAQNYLKPPKVRWQDHFARSARSAIAAALGGSGKAKYDRPSRRREVLKKIGWGKKAPILPVHHHEVPRIFVVADASGSMGSGDKSRFNTLLSEAGGILLSSNAHIMACSVDTAVQTVVRIRTKADLAGLCKGGGGTNMVPGILEAAKPEHKADCIILLTDGELGYGGWPTKSQIPDKVRLIVGIINERKGAFDQVPDYLKEHAVYIHQGEDE
jgi:hypothetical protein